MKKILSVVLAAVLALACLHVIVFAEDGYTKACSVSLENVTSAKVELVELTADNLKDAIAEPDKYVTRQYYVPEGETAVIALRTISTYIFDSTCRVKVYPSSMNADIISGVEYENSNYGTILNMTVLTNDEGHPIDEYGNELAVQEVDKQGYDRWEGVDKKNLIYVGTFANVTEDIVVKVYNVSDDSIGNVKDFLFSMFKFFENLIRWFFALTPFKQ
ncbi:MAG: hypothetical protein IJK89_13210 [Clostridia bacterium]|nr:hypothetical protein [Clostridia bacterium]